VTYQIRKVDGTHFWVLFDPTHQRLKDVLFRDNTQRIPIQQFLHLVDFNVEELFVLSHLGEMLLQELIGSLTEGSATLHKRSQSKKWSYGGKFDQFG